MAMGYCYEFMIFVGTMLAGSPVEAEHLITTTTMYPDLPQVETLLKHAPLEHLADEAEHMRINVEKQQDKMKAQLVTKKQAYTGKLLELVKENKALEGANVQIQGHIDECKRYNEAMHGRISLARQSNALLADAIMAVDPRLRLASRFIVDSMKSTNETNAADSAALPKSDSFSLQQMLKMARAELITRKKKVHLFQQKGTLLETSDPFPAVLAPPLDGDASPRDLVREMTDSLVKLERVQSESEAKLKARFLELFTEGLQQRQALLDSRKEFMKAKDREEAVGVDLKTTYVRLQHLHKALEARVKTVQAFALKAEEVALAAITESLRNVNQSSGDEAGQSHTQPGP